jgi:hypothetical protein
MILKTLVVPQSIYENKKDGDDGVTYSNEMSIAGGVFIAFKEGLLLPYYFFILSGSLMMAGGIFVFIFQIWIQFRNAKSIVKIYNWSVLHIIGYAIKH